MPVVLFGSMRSSNTVGRTEIDACGKSVGRRNSSEYAVLFSLKQEAPASIGGYVHIVLLALRRWVLQSPFDNITVMDDVYEHRVLSSNRIVALYCVYD